MNSQIIKTGYYNTTNMSVALFLLLDDCNKLHNEEKWEITSVKMGDNGNNGLAYDIYGYKS